MSEVATIEVDQEELESLVIGSFLPAVAGKNKITAVIALLIAATMAINPKITQPQLHDVVDPLVTQLIIAADATVMDKITPAGMVN